MDLGPGDSGEVPRGDDIRPGPESAWNPPAAVIVHAGTFSTSLKTIRGALAALGTAIGAAPLAGGLCAVSRMVQVLLEFQETGSSDTKAMAHAIGKALVPFVLGLGVGVFGLLLCLVVAVSSRFRARWFFWGSLPLAVIHLVVFPLGTLVGSAHLAVLFARRRQFFPRRVGRAAGA